jgi:putative toxin-antitoxin system antitoxin component (TIGR02293 family)
VTLPYSKIWGRTLGLKAENPSELIRQVERGFSFNTLRSMESHARISVVRIAAIIGIPERTLARRKTEGRLTSDESERLLRISRVFENTVDLFEGDSTNALKWLPTPKKAFENQTPLAYSRTELAHEKSRTSWADWSTASSLDLGRLLAGWLSAKPVAFSLDPRLAK